MHIGLILSNNGELAGSCHVDIGVAVIQRLALQFGVVHGDDSAVRHGVNRGQVGVLAAIGQSDSDGIGSIINHAAESRVLLEVEAAKGGLRVGIVHSEIQMILRIGVHSLAGNSDVISDQSSVLNLGKVSTIAVADVDSTVAANQEVGIAVIIVMLQSQLVVLLAVLLVHLQVVGDIDKDTVVRGSTVIAACRCLHRASNRNSAIGMLTIGGSGITQLAKSICVIACIHTQNESIIGNVILQVHRVPGFGIFDIRGQSVGNVSNQVGAAVSIRHNGQSSSPASAVHQTDGGHVVIQLGILLVDIQSIALKVTGISIGECCINNGLSLPIAIVFSRIFFGQSSSIHQIYPSFLAQNQNFSTIVQIPTGIICCRRSRRSILISVSLTTENLRISALAICLHKHHSIGILSSIHNSSERIILRPLSVHRVRHVHSDGALVLVDGRTIGEAAADVGSAVQVVQSAVVSSGEVGHAIESELVDGSGGLSVRAVDQDVIRSGAGGVILVAQNLHVNLSTLLLRAGIRNISFVTGQSSTGLGQRHGGGIVIVIIVINSGSAHSLGPEESPTVQLSLVVNSVRNLEHVHVLALDGGQLAIIGDAGDGILQAHVGDSGIHILVGHSDVQGVILGGQLVLRGDADRHRIGGVHFAGNVESNIAVAVVIDSIAIFSDSRGRSGGDSNGNISVVRSDQVDVHSGIISGAAEITIQLGNISAHGQSDVDGLGFLIDGSGLAADGQLGDVSLAVLSRLEEVDLVGAEGVLSVGQLYFDRSSIGASCERREGVIFRILSVGPILQEIIEGSGIHSSALHSNSFAASPRSFRAGIVQGKFGGHGEASLLSTSARVPGVAIGQQHSDVAGLSEQHSIQALFGGEGDKAGSGGDVQCVGAGVVVVGNNNFIAVMHLSASSVLVGTGLDGSATARSIVHSSGSAFGTLSPDPVTHGESLVGNHSGIVGHGDVDVLRADDGLAQLGNHAVSFAVDGELLNLDAGFSNLRSEHHSVLGAVGRSSSFSHGELNHNLTVLVAVLIQFGGRNSDIHQPVAISILCFLVGGCGGVLTGVVHLVIRANQHIHINGHSRIRDSAFIGVGALGRRCKLHHIAACCHFDARKHRRGSRSAERNHCDDQHERQKHRK